MAESKLLFRQESIDRMQSPEKTDDMIRVSTPKAWILAAALLLIVAGVLVWGFTGSIPKTVTANGVIYEKENNDAVCLLPVNISGQFLVGHEARITLADGRSIPGTVAAVTEDPYTYEEISELARSNWRLQTLWGDSEEMFQYGVTVGYEGDMENSYKLNPRDLVTVSVVLSDVKPIAYVFN